MEDFEEHEIVSTANAEADVVVIAPIPVVSEEVGEYEVALEEAEAEADAITAISKTEVQR